jgi:hypothetical protein
MFQPTLATVFCSVRRTQTAFCRRYVPSPINSDVRSNSGCPGGRWTTGKRLNIHSLNVGTTTALLVATVACTHPSVAVDYRTGYTFSRAERNAIEAVADGAARAVRALLPALPAELRLIVQTGVRVIPETGESGEVGLPSTVYWTVDPKRTGGVVAVVSHQLRATLFHEFYHLVRETSFEVVSLTDQAMDEGLATAFERDFGGAPVPWGEYPDDVAVWTKEFLALPVDAPREQWMFKHPDGRRWVGYKVGAYLADRAVRATGRSLAQLATVPTPTIIEWARPDR